MQVKTNRQRPSGGDGVRLHVVYGPKEAGKSTTWTAVGDLLYGIHPRSRIGFRQGNSALRIGAALRNVDGEVRPVRRRKCNGHTLLAAGLTETGLPERLSLNGGGTRVG